MPPTHTNAKISPSTVRAAGWALLASLFVVSYTSIAKHLATDLPIPVIVFMRCLFGIVFVGPFLVRRGIGGLATQRPALMLSRGITTMIGLYCIFTAVSLMPLADVVAIQYTKPVFASIAAVLVLREMMYGSRWLATVLAMVGMLVIVRPGFEDWNIGVLYALGAAVSAAYTTITVKFLTRTEPPDRIVAYMIFGMLVASAIPAALMWKMPTVEQFGWLALTGITANAFQQCLGRSYAAADTLVVMPFEFSRLIIAALFGFYFFGEVPGIWMWAGGVIIFGAGLYVVYAEARRGRAGARARSS